MGDKALNKEPFYLPSLLPLLFLENAFVAIKLQTTPKHRLRKCTGGKKQAAKWPKKLRALGSRDAGRDCFQCALNPTHKEELSTDAEGGGVLIPRISPGYPKKQRFKVLPSAAHCRSPQLCSCSRQHLGMSSVWGEWGWAGASVLRVVNEDKGLLSNYTPTPKKQAYPPPQIQDYHDAPSNLSLAQCNPGDNLECLTTQV